MPPGISCFRGCRCCCGNRTKWTRYLSLKFLRVTGRGPKKGNRLYPCPVSVPVRLVFRRAAHWATHCRSPNTRLPARGQTSSAGAIPGPPITDERTGDFRCQRNTGKHRPELLLLRPRRWVAGRRKSLAVMGAIWLVLIIRVPAKYRSGTLIDSHWEVFAGKRSRMTSSGRHWSSNIEASKRNPVQTITRS